MERCPTITSDFLELVEQLRKVQIEYHALASGRFGQSQRHALTRVEQRRKALEQKVDHMLVQYHEDLRKWISFTEPKKHSEVQVTYEVET